jgi:hypothetical protein
LAQVAGGVQTLLLQLSPALQQGLVAQLWLVPAQATGGLQMVPAAVASQPQVSAPLQHGLEEASQAWPVPAQTAGATQTVAASPGSHAQELEELQHSAALAQAEPVPAHAGTRQTVPRATGSNAQVSAASQQESFEQLAPDAAQVGPGGVLGLLLPEQPASSPTASAAARAR